MNFKLHVAAKKMPTPALKSNGGRLLQRRYSDQIQPDTTSLVTQEPFRTPDPPNLTSSSLAPPPGYHFGQMTVWPNTSPSMQPNRPIGQSNEQSEQAVGLPVQRQAEQQKEEEDQIQAKAQPGQAPTMMPDLEPGLQASQEQGQALPAETRALMEPRFGHAEGLAIQRRVEMRDVGRGEQSGFARLPELVERLNAISQGLTFSINGRELRYSVRESGTLSGFDRQMMGFVDQDPVLPVRLTNRHGLLGDRVAGFHAQVDVDAWTSGYVDIDDLLASTDLGLQSVLVHFLRERSATSNYASRIGGTNFTRAEFNRVHALGIEAEAELLRDFFGDPTIRIVNDSPSPTIRRVFRNSRGDLIRRRVTLGRGAERGVDSMSIDVRTRAGVTHTAEEYRRILEEERIAQQVARERLGGATEHTEGGRGVPAP